MNLIAKNEKCPPVLIDNVEVGSFVEIDVIPYSVCKIMERYKRGIKVINIRDFEACVVSYGSLCIPIEDVEINYKYKYKEYTDKEMLDFLGAHTINGFIECKKDAFSYKTELCNIETIRDTINRLINYFENK